MIIHYKSSPEMHFLRVLPNRQKHEMFALTPPLAYVLKVFMNFSLNVRF